MGFHISLKENDKKLLDKIFRHPKDFFGKPYAGNIIFIVGGSDHKEFEWLKNNIINLDSLTRNLIAYTIVTEEVRVEISLSEYYSANRPPKYLGKKNLVQIDKINHLKFDELLADGDYLDAITYGADILAKHFGVVNQQPCAIIYNGILGKNFLVVPLNDPTRDKFINILRSVIDELYKDQGHKSYIQAIEDLGYISEKTQNLERNKQYANNRLKSLPSDFELISLIEEYKKELTLKLRKGDHRRFRKKIKEIEYTSSVDLGFDLNEEQGKIIVGTAKTLVHLLPYLEKSWPLNKIDRNELDNILVTHVKRLFRNDKEYSINSKSEIEDIILTLKDIQENWVNEIITILDIESKLKSTFKDKQIKYQEERDKINIELKLLLKRTEELIKILDNDQAPSFKDLFNGELRKGNISKTMNTITKSVSEYTGELIGPKNLWDIIKALIIG